MNMYPPHASGKLCEEPASLSTRRSYLLSLWRSPLNFSSPSTLLSVNSGLCWKTSRYHPTMAHHTCSYWRYRSLQKRLLSVEWLQRWVYGAYGITIEVEQLNKKCLAPRLGKSTKLSQYFHQEIQIHPHGIQLQQVPIASLAVLRAAFKRTTKRFQKVTCRRSMETQICWHTFVDFIKPTGQFSNSRDA